MIRELRAAHPLAAVGRADEILVAFAEPAEQGRLTVLVRIILAIPHLIALYVLTIVSEVVALICWFAALFTGRLPSGLADFQVGYLRWLTRFSAYLVLLTDASLASTDFAGLAAVTSPAQYQQVVASTGLESLLGRFDHGYQALGNTLGAH